MVNKVAQSDVTTERMANHRYFLMFEIVNDLV